MPPKTAKKSIQDIPVRDETWYFAVRRLQYWVKEEGEEPSKPYIGLGVELDTGQIVAMNIFKKEPEPIEIQAFLANSMLKPEKSLKIAPHRPAEIDFEDAGFFTALQSFLKDNGIKSKHRPQKERMDLLVQLMEESLGGDEPEVPGLLEQKGVTPEIIKDFFAAAAKYFRAAPWIHLANGDVLSIQVPPEKSARYAIVLGRGGIEYGLLVRDNWDEIQSIVLKPENLDGYVSQCRPHSLTFEYEHAMPFEDIGLIEQYGCEIAAPDAYPLAMIFFPSEEIGRPDRQDLLWYQGALQAIPVFCQDYLKTSPDDEILPVAAEIPVQLTSGQVVVKVQYPAVQMPAPEQMPAQRMSQDERMFRLRSRSIEQIIAKEVSLRKEDDVIDPRLKKAQAMIYKAWGQPNPARRITLAQKALKTSADCTDAYVLLAEEQAQTNAEALDLYQKGIEAAERVLGEEFFKEKAGYFWGILETRPYMRALMGRAFSLQRMGRNLEALEIYLKMIRLNPSDHQGVRYLAIELLLRLNRDQEAAALLKKFNTDSSTAWLYSRALVAFRSEGDNPGANKILAKAVKRNPQIFAYLSEKKRVPNDPEEIESENDFEASEYADQYLYLWRRTPGAVEWLKSRS